MIDVMYRWTLDSEQSIPNFPDDVNIEFTKETGQQFFREKIGSKLVFQGDGYDYIMQQIGQDFGHRFEILLQKSVDGGATWEDYHNGQFHATDCIINADDRKVTVQPDTMDAYTDILAGLDNEYNLVEITDEVSRVNITKRPLLQAYVLGDSKVTCMLSGMVWEQDASAVDDDEAMVEHYNFNLDSIQREMNISGTGLPEANGLYIGTMSYNSGTGLFSGTLTPMESTGYVITCNIETIGPKPVAVGVSTIQIVRQSDSEVMYHHYATYDGDESSVQVDNEDFTFDNDAGTGTVTAEQRTYRMYTRVLTDVATNKPLPEDDLVGYNRNYRYCSTYAPLVTVVIPPDTTEYYGFVNPLGVWTANNEYSCRHYSVTVGQQLAFSGKMRGNGVPFITWFDANGDFISAEQYGTNYVTEYDEQPITVPAGAAWLYANVDNSHMSSFKVMRFTLGNATIGAISGVLSDDPTPWGRTDDGRYYVAPVVVGKKFQPIARTLWGYASLWVAVPSVTDTQSLMKVFTLRDAYSLTTTIKALLAKVDSTLTFDSTAEYSQFLYGTTNPVKAGVQIGTLFITQKTNLLRGEYSQPAMNAPITLGMVLTMLKNVYGLYWFIDEGKLRIEHISFFKNGGTYNGVRAVGADLTKMVNTRNGRKWSYLTSEWQYSKSEMAGRYEYAWMDEATDVFRGKPIEVVGTFVERGKIEEVNISGFNADIDYIMLSPSDVSEDGFALMAAVNSGGEMTLPMVNISMGGQQHVVQNGFLAMARLQPNYLTYDMPSWSLNVNGENATADGIMLGRTQQVRVPCGRGDLDIQKMIRTGIGDGVVQKMTMTLLSRSAKVTLGYPTYNAPTPVLPYDAEVEYIEGDGSQYIDTGLKGDAYYKYVIDYQKTTSSTRQLFGMRNQSAYNGGPIFCYAPISNTSDTILYVKNGTVNNTNNRFANAQDTNRHVLIIDFRNNRLTIDGNAASNILSPGDFVTQYNMFLFSNNVAGTRSNPIPMKLFAYQVYDRNGDILQDFIPVRVGTAGYMYDRVTGEMKGSETATAFVAGPDRNTNQ